MAIQSRQPIPSQKFSQLDPAAGTIPTLNRPVLNNTSLLVPRYMYEWVGHTCLASAALFYPRQGYFHGMR